MIMKIVFVFVIVFCFSLWQGSIKDLMWILYLTYNKVFLSASVQFSLVAQSCPTRCDPMNHSTSGLPVHHQLQEFTQTHVHRVSDAIQPIILCRSLLLLAPIPPSIRVFSMSQLFAWGGQSIGVSLDNKNVCFSFLRKLLSWIFMEK